MSPSRTKTTEPPVSLWLDRLLARRGTRHNTLGPTGARVFCSRLENAFGLRGRFAFVHDYSDDDALTDPAHLTIKVNGEALEGNRAACMWYPSHARRQVKELGLGVIESKFITWDDVLCDVVNLANHGEEPLTVRLEVRTAAATELARSGKDTILGSRAVYGRRLNLVLAMRATRSAPTDRLICELRLKPGEQTSLLIALAVGVKQNEAVRALGRWAGSDDPLAEQQRQYQRWFDANCPQFDCPEERLVRLWWYRWFLVRHNLMDARLGGLPHPCVYPVKSGAQARLSARHGWPILRELRWLRDPALAQSQIMAQLQTETPDGFFGDGWLQPPPTTPTPETPLDATVALPAAFGEALGVHPWPEVLPQLTAACARTLAALRKQRDPNNNLLLAGPTAPVERVDSTAFFAASLRATGELLGLLGKKVDAQWHEGLAEKCRETLVSQMWDEWQRFFCDRQDEAPCADGPYARQLLPFALGQVPTDPRYTAAFETVFSPEHLWSPYPVREVSREVDRQAGILPELNAVTAEALAHAVRHREHPGPDRRQLLDFITRSASLAFEEGDPYRPQSRERYDAESGLGDGALEVLSYSFSDLLIRLIAGLLPQGDETLLIDPLAEGWTHFRLDALPYRGHNLTIIWESRPEGERYPDATAGLTVRVDGQLVAQSPTLEKITAELPKR